MKRRLNILCLLVMLVFGYSIYESTNYFFDAFMSGFKIGNMASEGRTHKMNEIVNMKDIGVIPDDFVHLKDSVLNEKTGEYVPAMHIQMAVSLDTESGVWMKFFTLLSTNLHIITSLFSIFIFARLIISINKSDIFNWRNVRRLRWLGWSLILTFLFSAIPTYITAYELSGAFSLTGYSLTTYELVSTLTLVLGIVSLIVGEVFSIGLKIKEEQDLTI